MIRTIIVENEPLASEALLQLIETYCTDVDVLATARTLKEAKALIQQHNPDLVFLDVELDNESGFSLFDFFSTPPFDVIFTTAHSEYALQAIKFSCLDYLLKPIDYRELQAAVRKRERGQRVLKNQVDNLQFNLQQATAQQIAIPSADGYEFINLDNIIMVCAEGNYTRIYSNKVPVLSSRTLGELEKLFPPALFFRSHKSFLINWSHIEKFNKQYNEITMKGGLKAELALRRREEFLARIKG